MTEESFGRRLQAMRQKRGLTQAQLAKRSGVTVRTLAYWEADHHTPHLHELDGTVRALGLTTEERQTLIVLLPTRKAGKIIRAMPEWSDIVPPPGAGDLIRAMRWRKRLSRDQVAHALQTHRTTVMRWESSQTVPNEETRLRLCDLMSALPEERAALLAPPHTVPLWNGIAPPLDAYREEAARLERGSGREAVPLFDLRAYLLTGTLWNLAAREPEARLLLAQTYAARAVYSCIRGDDDAALDFSSRSLDLLAGETMPPKAILYLALWADGQAAAHRSPKFGPTQNIRQANRWILRLGTDRAPAFLFMNAALWAVEAGSLREARHYWQAANDLAERSETISVHVREGIQLAHASLLVQEGRYEEALAVELQISGAAYYYPITRHLFQTSVFLKMGEHNDADSHLRQAYALIAAEQADFFSKQADALAKQLE